MNQDSPGHQAGGTTADAGGVVAGPLKLRPQTVEDIHDLLYCGCGHPMHPDHVEKRRGIMLERYSCPQRRWWNAWHHPHAWAVPRERVSA